MSDRGRSGSSTGGRGGSSKTVKRKKQDYHRRKAHAVVEAEEAPDPAKKLLAGLAHLGSQKLSDSGGFGISKWVESFNLLLDDYEKSAGSGALKPAYKRAREEASKILANPPDTADLDKEMEGAREEIAKVLAEARAETQERQAKLAVLREQRAKASMELAGAKRELEEAKEPQPGGSFLTRIFAKRPPPTAPMEKRVAQLEKNLEEVEAKVKAAESGEAAKERAKKLEELETRLEELGNQRDTRAQMTGQRMDATAVVAAALGPAAPAE